MKRKAATILVLSVSALLLAFTVLVTVQTIMLARENQEMKMDLAEINHIQHGLLNADQWRDRVTYILSKKIIEFDLSPENREELQQSLETIMYGLLNDFEQIVQDKTRGSFAGMKRFMVGMILDFDQLRDSVPPYANRILDELNQPSTKKEIQVYLAGKLEKLSVETGSLDSLNTLSAVVNKYETENREECQTLLEEKTGKKSRDISYRVLIILLSVMLIFALNMLHKGPLRWQSAILILASLCLLAGGIITPMIDLEAMIDQLHFQLVGEEIVFNENIIFFQSKSITDIVEILIRDGAPEMILVGIMIFCFSIVFPLSKLLSTWLYSLGKERIRNNRLIRFFVLKSGKWSMADVMVVAIFMAYIGFNGIVSSQLNSLKEAADPVEIFTTNGTRLLGGFYLFLSFCISSLILSEWIQRKNKNRKTGNAQADH